MKNLKMLAIAFSVIFMSHAATAAGTQDSIPSIDELNSLTEKLSVLRESAHEKYMAMSHNNGESFKLFNRQRFCGAINDNLVNLPGGYKQAFHDRQEFWPIGITITPVVCNILLYKHAITPNASQSNFAALVKSLETREDSTEGNDVLRAGIQMIRRMVIGDKNIGEMMDAEFAQWKLTR